MTPGIMAKIIGIDLGTTNSCVAVVDVTTPQVIPNREPHKMQGLMNLLADNTLDHLQALARTGLDTVRATLREAV